MKSFMVVGELNPYGTDPRTALYHLPRGASGDKLREHLGLRDATYARLRKVNLCTGKWDRVAAAVEASRLREQYEILVTLGVKAARAVRGGAETPLLQVSRHGDNVVLALPHPSGRCHLWNVPATQARALVLLREHLPEVPWGEVSS